MAYSIDNIAMLSYIKDYKKYILPSSEQLELLIRYRESNDIDSRNRLILSNIGMVGSQVSIYIKGNPHIDPDELFDEGLLGLFKAIDKFSFDKNTNFNTFATVVVQRNLLMYLRNHKKEIQALTHLNDTLINQKTNVLYEVHEILEADIDIEDDVISSIDMLSDIESIRESMNDLSDTELYVIYHRYLLDEPTKQRELANALGTTQSYVCKVEKRALSKIRKYMMEKESQNNDKQ